MMIENVTYEWNLQVLFEGIFKVLTNGINIIHVIIKSFEVW